MRRRANATSLSNQRPSKRSKSGKISGTGRRGSFLPANFLIYIVVIVSICLAAAFLKTYVLSLALIGSPNITITGNEIISTQKILNSGGLSGCSIFSFSTSDVVSKLKKIPWIESVSVRKKLPNSVYINIGERKPFAWIDNNGLKLIDKNGIVLNFMPQVKGDNLFTVKGLGKIKSYQPGEKVEEQSVEEATMIIKQLNTTASWIKDKVSGIDVSDEKNPVLVMNSYLFEIYLGEGMIPEKMENLKKVFYSFNEEERTQISLFDLRFKDRVIIRTDKNAQIKVQDNNAVKET